MQINQDELKAILQETGVSFKQNLRSFILSCPRCKKREKLYIRKSDARFVCWYCKEIDNFQGRGEYALAELSLIPISEIKARLYGQDLDAQQNDTIVFKAEDFLDDEEEIELFRESVLPTVQYTPDILPIDSEHSVKGVEYLKARGVSLELALKYQLAYSTSARRVIFPVIYRNEIFGWQGRYIGKQSFVDDETNEIVKIPKSLTSLGFKKDKALMFRDNLINSNHCVLCEGPFDGIKADLCGGNVVTMGKAVSKAQIDIIKSHGIKKIFLALDPDAASEARRIFEQNKDLEIYDMRPQSAKDLGEMSLDEVKRLFDSAERMHNDQIMVYIRNHYEGNN